MSSHIFPFSGRGIQPHYFILQGDNAVIAGEGSSKLTTLMLLATGGGFGT
jgi:hypothetical protein